MVKQLIRDEKFTNIQKAQAGLTRLFRSAAKTGSFYRVLKNDEPLGVLIPNPLWEDLIEDLEAMSSPNFKAFVKTIFHENSTRSQKGLNKWIHPDLVGVRLPFFDFDHSTLGIQKELFWTAVRFFSFEMKKELNLGNLRECYFQAVSNSNWANEGYLVVLNVKDEDGELMSELRRLNNAFGIGLIKLNAQNINESEVLLPSRIKQELDWDTIDLLLKKNEDFKEFMEVVKGDISLGKVANHNNYDHVLDDKDFEKYVLDKKILLSP